MKKLIDQIKEFFGSLINAEKPTSSKRFVALFCLLLVTYVVVRFINNNNVIEFVDATYIFIATLLGIGAVQSIIKDRSQNKTK